MGVQKLLVIVNNRVIRDEHDNPIRECIEGSKVYYSNGKDEVNYHYRVKEVIAQIQNEEREDPLYEAITRKDIFETTNREFKIKIYMTPLYELMTQLAANPKAGRIAGTSIDLASEWEERKYRFYLIEFFNYSVLMDYLEATVRTRRPSNSIFTVKNGNNRVMNVLYTKVESLFNPLDTLTELKNTQLLSQILGADSEEQTSFSVDDPYIFSFPIMRGAVPCYFATSTDILAMCGIKHKEAISSRNIYRLIAGLYLKTTFRGLVDEKMLSLAMTFPIGETYWQVLDEETFEVERNFTTEAAAKKFANNNYIVARYDTDAQFISSAFESYKKKNVTQDDELLHQIRGGDFVLKTS